MNEEDLSSDLSDEDYVPEGNAVLPSEEESDGEPEEDLGTEENTGKKRGKSKTKRKSGKNKKPKLVEEPEQEEVEPAEEKPLSAEEEKKKADSLWADFLKDTDTKPKPKPDIKETEKKVDKPVQKPSPPKKEEKTVSVTKIFEFAGEEVRVTKEVPADSLEARVSVFPPARGRGRGRSSGGSGLSSVLNQLGKKEKISTLEKSKLDWDHFKKAENIEDEIQSHNKGKDGYLERQDFLERADLRQFELEKEFRTKQRSHRL